MTAPLRFPLSDLSPIDFERLCFELMKAEEENLLAGKSSIYGPAVARPAEKSPPWKTAIDVKHRAQFNLESLKKSVATILGHPSKFSLLLYLTSAPIPDHMKARINHLALETKELRLKVLGQQEIDVLLHHHPSIAEQYFKRATTKKWWQRALTSISAVALAISITAIYEKFTSFTHEPATTTTLESKISEVESNLQGLKSLENSLNELKIELQDKSTESARIQVEYQEALKLKSITQEEIDLFRKATSTTDIKETAMNYFIGFIVGVFGSILATIITDKFKSRREMSKT